MQVHIFVRPRGLQTRAASEFVLYLQVSLTLIVVPFALEKARHTLFRSDTRKANQFIP